MLDVSRRHQNQALTVHMKLISNQLYCPKYMQSLINPSRSTHSIFSLVQRTTHDLQIILIFRPPEHLGRDAKPGRISGRAAEAIGHLWSTWVAHSTARLLLSTQSIRPLFTCWSTFWVSNQIFKGFPMSTNSNITLHYRQSPSDRPKSINKTRKRREDGGVCKLLKVTGLSQ